MCGPSKAPTPCTSKKKKLNKVTLTVGASDASTATSKAFKPTAVGTWCFAGYYSGSSKYKAGSDTTVEECFTVQQPQCGLTVTISPNPLVETGASQVDAVVQVEACTKFAGDKVNIGSQQLTVDCLTLTFGSLQPGAPPGNPITVILDNDGNATVSVTGTDCAPGTDLIEADLVAAPYLTATTNLSISPAAGHHRGSDRLPSQ